MARRDIGLQLVTLRELCEISGAPADFVVEMVEFGILEPAAGDRAPGDRAPDDRAADDRTRWEFGDPAVRRSRRAVNLMRDFGINMEGLSLVLDLLEELDTSRHHVRALERLLRD